MDEIKMAERIAMLEQSTKSAHKRLDELHELTTSVAGMVNEIKHMREDVNRLSSELDAVRDRPMKRYDLIITSVLTTLIGAGVGYLLSMIF